MTSASQPIQPPALDERLIQATLRFNAREWYAAHDGFEELWHESSGDERQALHGIIQVAVAEHHLLNGNLRGSLLLMAEGLNHLKQSPPHLYGLDLQALQLMVEQRLAQLQASQSLDDLPLPQLKPWVPTED